VDDVGGVGTMYFACTGPALFAELPAETSGTYTFPRKTFQPQYPKESPNQNKSHGITTLLANPVNLVSPVKPPEKNVIQARDKNDCNCSDMTGAQHLQTPGPRDRPGGCGCCGAEPGRCFLSTGPVGMTFSAGASEWGAPA
jgi:hypothetical protein